MSEQAYLRADSLTRRVPDAGQDSIVFRLLHAHKTRDVATERKLTEQLLNWPGGPYMRAPLEMARMDPHAAASLAEKILAARKPGPSITPGRMSVATIEGERGRWRAAFAQLDAAGADHAAIDRKVSYAMMPLVQLSPQQLAQLYETVERSDSTAKRVADPRLQLQPHFRLFNLGMLSCKLGQPAQALRFADRIEQLPVPEYWRASMSALAANIRAQVDIARGNPKAALARLDSIATDPPFDLYGTPAERNLEMFWRAELLYLTGRVDEALKYFENAPDGLFYYDLPVRTYTTLRRAELLDRKGSASQAVQLYAQVLHAWRAADPELQPLVQWIRSRLARDQQRRG